MHALLQDLQDTRMDRIKLGMQTIAAEYLARGQEVVVTQVMLMHDDNVVLSISDIALPFFFW